MMSSCPASHVYDCHDEAVKQFSEVADGTCWHFRTSRRFHWPGSGVTGPPLSGGGGLGIRGAAAVTSLDPS